MDKLSMMSRLGFVVVCAGCSAQSMNPDMNAGLESTDTAPQAAAAGVSAASAGRAAATGTAGTSVISRSAAGATGSLGPDEVAPVTPAAGASGGAAQAGTGGSPVTAAAGTSGAAGAGGMSSAADGCAVMPITDDMRKEYDNMEESYYTKYASANGIIVGTGPKVSDEALIRYCRLLGEMHSNEDVRKAVIADKMWFTMIDEDEQLSDLPQIDRAYGTSLNQRARGLGGLTPTICAEDSIMCLPGDRWNGDCICPHEAGHTLYSSGIARVPELSDRLTKITDDARASRRLSNAYVWMDGNESGMMAWGVQVWYDCAINGTNGGYHSDINTRAELEKEMPEFHQFLSELMPADNKYEDCYKK